MMQNPSGQYLAPSQVGVRPDARLSQAFLTQSFFWMFLGLLVTTGVGFLISSLPEETLVQNAGLALPLLIVQLVVAFVLSLAIRKISATVGLLLFFVYAALTGVTLGFVLLTYELGSIVAAGSSAAAVFGAAAIYGAVTKRDLSGFGPYLFMGLVGIIVASLVNLFIGWQWLSFGISVLGVVIFTGLTAYDVQKIQRGDVAAWAGSMEKGAVMGAFKLYLDFVNLFFMLLRLFGNGRS
ncbi:MAG TPA: Bax inhibitor-1/YccA family protein [Candidatus Nanopelagicales bacterium]|nr:Bax inhibitor-1/YccA family protein [Candidatus Nanopelagicales bacterium]